MATDRGTRAGAVGPRDMDLGSRANPVLRQAGPTLVELVLGSGAYVDSAPSSILLLFMGLWVPFSQSSLRFGTLLVLFFGRLEHCT